MKRALEKKGTFPVEAMENNMCMVQPGRKSILKVGNERLEKSLGMSFYKIVLVSTWTS